MELEKTPEPHPFKVENRRGAAFVRPLEIQSIRLRCRLRLQGFFGLFDQPFKGLFVANGQISQDLAIERDFRGFQTFLKTAVADALGSASGIDTDDPKLTHRPFLNAPIAISVLQSVIDRFFSVLVETRLVAEVALACFSIFLAVSGTQVN